MNTKPTVPITFTAVSPTRFDDPKWRQFRGFHCAACGCSDYAFGTKDQILAKAREHARSQHNAEVREV